MSVLLFPDSNDHRIIKCVALWREFCTTALAAKRLGIIYHGDVDGLIGASYAYNTLKLSSRSTQFSSFWIGTDEYDFVSLRKWVSDQDLDACVILDISIENSTDSLDEISRLVQGKVFIFDHHIVYREYRNQNVLIANPTPQKISTPDTPLPTFTFAHALALLNNLPFPKWLILLGIFTEGVDSFLEPAVSTLSAEILGGGKIGLKPRDLYRGSALSKAASLLKTAFSLQSKHEKAFEIMNRVALGKTDTLEVFLSQLEAEFEDEAKRIRSAINQIVADWKERLAKNPCENRLVVVPVNDVHAVSATVASVLRGSWPNKVVMTWIRQNDKAIIELRTDNNSSLNLVDCLKQVSDQVQLVNYGGHAPAAGATLALQNLSSFQAALENALRG